MANRGKATVTICSAAFLTLGQAQAQALGHASLPIAVIPHPFGLMTREEVRQSAESCVHDIARLLRGVAT